MTNLDTRHRQNALEACAAARTTLLLSMGYQTSPEIEQALRSLNSHMEGLRFKIEVEQQVQTNKKKG